ncbi:MAG: CoA transferase [Rubellimicrobium sp.]|nr:CoA transferase [Rubellimicrobium sp.]
MMRPLEGITVVEFAQYLSGPFAGLKLADLGARVIKVERPGTGDPCRGLFISDPVQGENTLFHAINRGKESLTADLRDPSDRAMLQDLVARADVVIQNFRPGVIERQGFGHEACHALNPGLVYGSISGFGETDWRDLPGQDLLAQSRSGLVWLSGSRDDPPVPMGLAVADMLSGEALTQGILAALVGRGRTGQGALVETSLLEAVLSFQFEVLTTHLNDGGKLPDRAGMGGAHAYIGAPYGIYPTADGWLALAMVPSLAALARLMDLPELAPFADDPALARSRRDEIKAMIARATPGRRTADWLALLQPADIWCAEVLDWAGLRQSPVWAQLGMERLFGGGDFAFRGIRGPVRLDGAAPCGAAAAPALGADRARIIEELSGRKRAAG